MNTAISPRHFAPQQRLLQAPPRELSSEDRAFVRLAAAIVGAPEEIILASLLARRTNR